MHSSMDGISHSKPKGIHVYMMYAFVIHVRGVLQV